MVDFKKRITKKDSRSELDPVKIYETLDRASDKGPLRPAQIAILSDWYKDYRNKKDVIIKLHTGQGKTLIGLLTLESMLREKGGPVAYFCPNNFLIEQTCLQAKQFGIRHCVADPDLPHDFLGGDAILITSIHKLFNGRTKFGLGNKSISLTSLAIDDCHACIDSIRDSFTIKLDRTEQAYTQLLDLFATCLEDQGIGTYADIRKGDGDSLLPVPYWEWKDKASEVTTILAKNATSDSIKFTWPLVKDIISDCRCIVSGTTAEITPYLPPLELFGSFYKSKHRIFMSATVTDDSFLVKGLRLNQETILKPLVYKKEKWSGEKMILIPSLIEESLSRSPIVAHFASPKGKLKYGTVVLVPSFKYTLDWEKYGAIIAKTETIVADVDKLRKGQFSPALVFANRYDGIDLPDDMCRVLILDSKPYFDSSIDRYEEGCRSGSESVAIGLARRIEQGLGRSVRGEKDYCVIVITGTELVKLIRSQAFRKHLSSQTRAHIEIGLEIAELAQEDIEKGVTPLDAFLNLVHQCLSRDPYWKDFYAEKMDEVVPTPTATKALQLFNLELDAEAKFQKGDVEEAITIIQKIIDGHISEDTDRHWYLQEMARYKYTLSQTDSNKLQLEAHRGNRVLMKPRLGMKVDKLQVVSKKRMSNIISWLQSCPTFEELFLVIEDILSNLTFGTKADRFEQAFAQLGKALGFSSERPDKEWKAGPDNLWALGESKYLLVECKSEVQLNRAEIVKDETGQMNNACAWFEKHYHGVECENIMIIPTNKLSRAAGFNSPVKIMRQKELSSLTKNVKAFFNEFMKLNRKDLSEEQVQALIQEHHLDVQALMNDYGKSPV